MIGVGLRVLPTSTVEQAGKKGRKVAVLRNTTSGAAVTTVREAPLEILGVSKRSLILIKAADTNMKWRIVLAVAHPREEIYLIRKPLTISREGTINGSMAGQSPLT